MDNKKFEQLIDLIINENEEQARAMFHDIVVEKSREIYESIMDDEFSQDQVGGLADEIQVEEEGMVEAEDEFADIGDDDGEEEVALDSDDIGGEETGEEDLEDRVVDLEDKLDELMAEFESIMSGEEGGDMGGEEEFGGDMGGEDMGDEMMEGEEEDLEESEDDEEETLEEAVQLQKVSVTHGDNGTNTKSIVSNGPKVGGNGAKAVNFTSGESTKGGTQGGLLNPATKDLRGAGSFKNAPGQKGQKLDTAPKAKHGDDGQNTKSIVGESRKTVKRIVK